MDSKEIFYIRKQYNNNIKDDLPYEYSEKEKIELIYTNYKNALELLKQDKDDIWNIKAYIYVASDICKVYVKYKEYNRIKSCIDIINTLKIENDDEILIKTVNKIKSYLNTNTQLLLEIKQLRDKKEYEKAYNLSKKINIQQHLNDDYTISSYIYPITDMCIQSYEQKEMDKFHKYYKELCSLNININNEFLINRLSKINKLADITYKEQQEAKKLYNNKQYKEALEVYQKIIKIKNDISINMSMGWCIYHVIKENIENKVSDTVSKKLLMQYLGLNVEKPSLLHSQILKLAIEINEIKLYKFLELWDTQYFREDDFKQVPMENNNLYYNSLVQKIIDKLIDDIDIQNNTPILEKYKELIDKVIDEAKDDIFAVRIRGFINLYLNNIHEAEQDLLYVLKNKIHDFWVWSDLGLIFLKKNEIMKTLACYCKSLLLIPNERLKSSLRIRKKMIDILLALKLYNEAKYETHLIYNIRKEHNYKTDNNIVKFMNSDWFINAIDLIDNKKFYIEHSKNAEKELYKQLNKIEGILGNKFENKSNKICYNIYYKDNNNKINSYTVKNNMVNIQCKEEGTPIYVYMDYNKLTNKDEIYGIEERESGDKFDIIDRQIGVVNYVDTKTSRVNIVVSMEITENLYVDNKNHPLSVGDTVYVRLLYNKKYKVVTCDKIEEEVKTNLKQTFFDVVEHISLAGDAYISHVEKIDIELLKKYHYVPVIYIHRDLVKRFHLEEGDEVRCVSVLAYNKKKAQWGWSALSVEKVEFKNLDIDELENYDIED